MPTNLLLSPNTPYSSGDWPLGAGTSTHTEAYALGADGVSMTAWLVTDTDAGAVHTNGQNVAVPANVLPYCFYYYVRKTVGAITNAPALIIFHTSGNYALEVQTTTGTVTAVSAGGWSPPTSSGILDGGNGYWLAWITLTNTSQVNYNVQLAPAMNGSANGGVDVTVGGGAVFWGGGFIQATAPVITPVASFTPTSSSGTNPLTVVYTDTSTNTPTSWAWNFGDGSTSTSQNPSHTFATGSFTVTLTATNVAGSSQATAPVTVAAATMTANVWQCVGSRYAAISSTTLKTAISSQSSHHVMLADAAIDPNLWPDSGILAGEPGALVYGSTLWVACADGYIRKLNTTTAALISSVRTYAATNAWLAQNAEGIVIAPGSKGQVATITGTTITEVYLALPSIDAAVYTTSRYLYCFGNGRVAVMTVSAAGMLAKIGEYAAAGCRDIKRAKLMSDGRIAVACKDRVVSFSLTDPTTPAWYSETTGVDVVSVLDDTSHTPITQATGITYGAVGPVYDILRTQSTYSFIGPTASVTVVT